MSRAIADHHPTEDGALAQWWRILKRTYEGISESHVSLTAAGVAFYGLLAVFPAIAAVVSLWGLLADPQHLEGEIAGVSTVLPAEARSIIVGQAQSIASNAGSGITFATIFGILFTIFSTSKGVKALMEGLNVIHGERETRGFVRLNAVSLALTFGAVAMAVIAFAAVVVVPAVVAALGLDRLPGVDLALLRWPLLALVTLVGLAVLYGIAPSGRRPVVWLSWGTVVATVLWLAASGLFSLYVGSFGTYNETYGALGGVIILLMWLWISAFVVLLGAILDAEIARERA